MWMFPMFLPNNYHEPPTIYSILHSYVNFGKEEQTKIKNLAKDGRGIIFDFNYPLNNLISKEDFETLILNHFMMRRIGYETVTAFKLALNVKLNEIMPMYNKLFNAISSWEIFEDGEMTERIQTDERESNSTNNINTNNTNNITNDSRFSDTPQGQIEDVKNGNYVSNYNLDTNISNGNSSSNGSSNAKDNGTLHETIKRTPADKMKNYIDFIKEKQNIYTMIFKDLDSLFYQII